MRNLNLVLSFKLAGDSDCRVCGVARIKVDGQGGLTLYDTANDVAERIDLTELQSLSIHPVAYAGRAA